MDNILTQQEADVLNGLMPGNQNVSIGSKLYWVMGMLGIGGTTYFVNSGVTTSGDGKTWTTAFLTIAEAVSAASAGDTIYIKGEFTITSTILVDKELTLIGANTTNNQYNTMIYGAGAFPLITIKANNCKVVNLGFAQAGASYVIQIGNANAQNWYKLHISGCKFDGWSASTGGVHAFHSTVDAPDIQIDNCLFRSFDGDCILSNWTRARIENNIILVTASKSGISHVPNAGDRPDTIIRNNVIVGANSGDTGIELVGTPSAGLLIAYENKIYNCATSLTQAATNVAVQHNYVNDGAGGALIDPIA